THVHQSARMPPGGVRRHHSETRIHEAAHGLHRFAELVVGFGSELGVAGDLAMRFAVIIHAPEIIAVGHRCKRSVERENLKPMARKIKIANDFWPQEGDDVRADGTVETGKNFFRYLRTAAEETALNNQNLPA